MKKEVGIAARRKCIALSFVFVLMQHVSGHYLLPRLLNPSNNIRLLALVGFMVLAIVSIFILACLFVAATQQDAPFATVLQKMGRIFLVSVLLILAALVVSCIMGLITVLIDYLTGNNPDKQNLYPLLNGVLSILGLLLVTCFADVFFANGLGDDGLKNSISAHLKTMHKRYIPLLLLITGTFVVEFILNLLFGLFPVSIYLTIIHQILSLGVGTIALVMVITFYTNKGMIHLPIGKKEKNEVGK